MEIIRDHLHHPFSGCIRIMSVNLSFFSNFVNLVLFKKELYSNFQIIASKIHKSEVCNAQLLIKLH